MAVVTSVFLHLCNVQGPSVFFSLYRDLDESSFYFPQSIYFTWEGFITSFVLSSWMKLTWLVLGMLSCAIILLHVTTRSLPRRVSERVADPTIHQPRSVWTSYGSSLLPANPLFGLIAIGQLDPISIPTSWFSSSGALLSPIFFRCCHLSAADRDGIWSFLDGIVSHIRFREFGLRVSVGIH